MSPARLAYYDTFAGLVPCRVLATLDDGSVEIRLTATRGAYRRGEVLLGRHDYVIPRHRVYVKDHKYKILSGWDWITGEGTSKS